VRASGLHTTDRQKRAVRLKSVHLSFLTGRVAAAVFNGSPFLSPSSLLFNPFHRVTPRLFFPPPLLRSLACWDGGSLCLHRRRCPRHRHAWRAAAGLVPRPLLLVVAEALQDAEKIHKLRHRDRPDTVLSRTIDRRRNAPMPPRSGRMRGGRTAGWRRCRGGGGGGKRRRNGGGAQAFVVGIGARTARSKTRRTKSDWERPAGTRAQRCLDPRIVKPRRQARARPRNKCNTEVRRTGVEE